VTQMFRPQRDRDFGHAHWHTLVPGFGLRDGIDREDADSVGGGMEIGV
jgi:hypothetical protein